MRGVGCVGGVGGVGGVGCVGGVGGVAGVGGVGGVGGVPARPLRGSITSSSPKDCMKAVSGLHLLESTNGVAEHYSQVSRTVRQQHERAGHLAEELPPGGRGRGRWQRTWAGMKFVREKKNLSSALAPKATTLLTLSLW